MPYKPQDLTGTGTPAVTTGGVTPPPPIDIDVVTNVDQIYVDGASSDVYNKDEMFDRNRLISLASIEFDKIEFDGLLDLLNAKIFEHELDRSLIQEVYSRANLDNLAPQLEKLDNEIILARGRLNAAGNLYDIIKNAERSFVDPERFSRIQTIWNQLTKERLENPLVKIPEEMEHDLVKAIHDLTQIPEDKIKSLPPTYLYMQLLDDLKQYFVEGGHPGLMLWTGRHQDFDNSKAFQIASGHLSKLWHSYSSEEGRKPLYVIGLPKNNTQADFVFGNAGARMPKKKYHTPIKRVAQICSQLASEYRLSAGLGKVRGKKNATKLALSAAKKFPFHFMLGGTGVDYVHQNSAVKGSLQDFAVVHKDGNLHGPGSNIALFDGYAVTGNSTANYTDVRTAFIDDVRENPSNNSMNAFDKIISEGNLAFSEIESLLNDATCANENVNILTPQGLFIRVLEEFCKLIIYQGYEGDEDARAEQLIGTHVLGLCRGQYADGNNSWSGVLKYRLNSYIQRLIMRRREAAGVVVDRQVRVSSREFSKGFKADLEEVAFDRRLVAETMIALSSKQATNQHSYMQGIDVPTGLIYDPAKYKDEFVKNASNDTTQANKAAILSGDDILDINKDIDGSEGFLRGIADIFEEMEKEAMTLAGEESFINQNRLTNHSGFDAALTTMMILECFCLLSESFAKTHLLLGVKTQSQTILEGIESGKSTLVSALIATADEEGDGLTDISGLQYSDYVKSLRGIRTTENAHEHVFGNTTSQEFADVFANTVTGQKLSTYYGVMDHAMNVMKATGLDSYIGKWFGGGEYLGETFNEFEGNMIGDQILRAAGYHGDSFEQASAIIKSHDSAESFIKHVATKLRNRGESQFKVGRHVLLYEQGTGDGRQTLLEILAAAKDGDLDQLFNDPNQKTATFIANEGRVPYDTKMARHDVTLTPSAVVDVIQDLALSHVAPSRLFDICKAMFVHLDASTADLSTAAAALRSSSPTKIVHRGTKVQDPNEQLQALVSLTKSKAGRKLVRGFSKRQLEIIESRFQALEATGENQGYIVDFLSEPVERAIRMYMDHLKYNGTRGKFVFYGIPSGKLERMLYNKDAEKIDEEGYDSSTFNSFFNESFDGAELDLFVQAIDELQPEIKHKSAHYNFPLDISIDAAGIAAAYAGEEQPNTMEQLVRFSEFTIDSPLTKGTVKATGTALLPKYGIAGLRNVLQSFLIKKIAEIAFSMDISERETVHTKPLNSPDITKGDEDRTSSAAQLMKDLAKTFLPDPKLVSRLFDGEKKLMLPTKRSIKKYLSLYAQLSQNDESGLVNTRTHSSEKDLLISLFYTKPFFADSIESYVSRPSEFDYIFAIFVDKKSTPIDEFQTKKTNEGKVALENQKLQGENGFSLKTIHTAATIRNREQGALTGGSIII